MNTMVLRAAALAAGALLAVAGPAAAHVSLEKAEAVPGAYMAVFNVGHGCDGKPTTRLTVLVPAAFKSVRPMPKAGWTLDIKKSGSTVQEVSWTGSLEDAHFDQFVLRGQIAPEAAGKAVPMPVIQECGSERLAWDEVAAPGQDPHALKAPAPVLRVAGVQAPDAVKAGDLTVSATWARATPGGAKVGGGYVTIRNTGTVEDRLIGGTLAKAGKLEIHDMAVKDGVMTMRPLAEGVAIAPGETVVLGPGGKHLMFMELKEGLKDGETVAGTLVFQKAGTVAVQFRVTGIGAREAPGAMPAGHKH